ncbi:MAG: hypothetical protein OXG81_12230 [Acidobacteria bacterium]|nr:hypothetical protein [Acidobacteriota bacterium]
MRRRQLPRTVPGAARHRTSCGIAADPPWSKLRGGGGFTGRPLRPFCGPRSIRIRPEHGTALKCTASPPPSPPLTDRDLYL